MATDEEKRLLEKLEAEREVFSMDFHQAQKEFQEVLVKEPEDIGLIKDALEVFQDEVDEYFQFDVRYQNAYYDVHGSCEEYQLVVLLAKKQLREAKMLLNKTRRRLAAEEDDKQSFVSCSQGGGGGQNRRRLPKLNLPTFSGDIKDWLTFWSQFEDIHNDPSIPSVDKFQYLLQAMTPGTVAHEIVKGFALTAKNYDAAVKGLMERYNRESALVKVYVLDLLDLVTSNRNQETISLSSLYVQLSSKLRALETLGVTTEKCAFVVYPLVECCLPKDILTVWHRDPTNKDEDDCTTQLENLMSFLKKEVNGEDNMRMAGGGATGSSKEQKRDRFVKLDRGNGKPTTATDLLSTTNEKTAKKSCVFCGGSHSTESCGKACKMTVDERKKCLRDNRSCFNCLKIGHDSRQCRGNPQCLNCGGKHETVMCYRLASQLRTPDDVQQNVSNTSDGNVAEISCDMTNITSDGNVVFLKTLLVKVQGRNRIPMEVRAIIDDASHKSYILKSLVKKLDLTPIKKEAVIHCLYTGQQTEVTSHTVYAVTISDMEGNYCRQVNLSDSECISSNINCYRNGPWIEELDQRGVVLSDLNTIDGPADVLLGANLAGSLLTGNLIQLECGAVAVETKLGWTLLGETDIPAQRKSYKHQMSMLSIPVTIDTTLLHMTGDNVDKLWRLDTLGITDPIEKKGKIELDEETLQTFFDSVKINEEGRVEVHLPWIDDKRENLPSYRWIAERKLKFTSMRLVKDGKLSEYNQLFQQWLDTEKIEVVPPEELENHAHYLQHRAVYNPSSTTTPTRPVFNASYRAKGNPALNDCLKKGPNLLELIPTLCTRFRLDKVGVLADITKAFQQISVVPSDRDCCRFLWWSDLSMKKVVVFRRRRVVFGVNASPFLLAATLKYVFSTVPETSKEIATQLDKSFYVDNLVAAVSSYDEASKLQKSADDILSTVKMELRGWEIGPSSEEKTASLLGMKWNMLQDTIVIDVPDLEASKEVTRRSILSTANSVFDPLGFVSPFMLNFKVLIQETWKEDKSTRKKIGWDTPVSEEIKQKYEKLVTQLPKLKEIEIPRWISSLSIDRSNWTLHVFVDGSKQAYACCAFLRIELGGEVNVSLLESRSRVVPVGGATIPRTELLSCLIGVRLATFVKANLEFSHISTFFYTDSSTALHWISKDDDWGVFVRNRRKQILENSKISEWRHIPGEYNPADLPSRGCTAEYLLKSRWWEGPTWLYKSEEHWPKSAVSVDIEIVESEKKKLVSSMLNCSSVEKKLYDEICKLNTIEEMLCKIGGERMDAERILLQLAQNMGFPAHKDDKRLRKLEVFEDDGMLRVKTRLFYASFEEEFRCPIVLPPECKIVQCLIMKMHVDHCHGRVSFLLTKLREKYWILKCRRTIRQVLRKCTSCRRFDAQPMQVNTPPLPKERIEATTPFDVTGIDLAGPMFLKAQKKAWMVLFTCAVYRAIHLELVTSLNTPNFKLALRRFVSRRGRPQIIYTDNGTNFVGCSNELETLDWKDIQECSAGQGIDWRFIPPASPWWGGFWERLVGVTKDLLKRTLGQATLNQIELITLLTDVEATVNERPLTYVSEDPDTLIPLTPALFLLGNKRSTIPELDEVDRRGLCKRAKYLQQIREELRGRFKKEYLGQLGNLKQVKDSPGLKVGDVVLVQYNTKRLNWPLGKITELVTGRDGKVRVVRVRTKDGEMKRSIQRIYPLEINQEGGLDDENEFKFPKEATILCLDSVANN